MGCERRRGAGWLVFALASLGLLACQVPSSSTGQHAIIHGEPIGSDEFPAAAALISRFTLVDFDLDLTQVSCTATLIAPDAMLTAAHCVDEVLLTGGWASEGLEFCFSFEADLSWTLLEEHQGNPPLPQDAVCSSGFVGHPSFDVGDLGGGLVHGYDIALVFLEDAIHDRSHAWLVTDDEADDVADGLPVDIVGYGEREADPEAVSPPLRYWAESEVNLIAQWEMQIGAGGLDGRKCHGDSGGPTFAAIGQVGDSERLIGVTSHSWDEEGTCDVGGVDTRVDAYLDWIDDELRAACSQGLRSACDEPGIPDPAAVDDDDAASDDDDSWSGPSPYEEGTFEEASYGCQSCGAQVAGRVAGPALLLLLLPALARRRAT